MEEISIKESREIQLLILKAVHKYCLENNIRYTMTYGTLLGAVRHKGFIPWDDDIDIAMPYPDYVRFCQCFGIDKYKVNHWTKEKGYHCNFAKVEDTGTISEEMVGSGIQLGVNIDVAPIIGLPEDLNAAKRYFNRIVFFRNLMILKKMTTRKKRSFLKQSIVVMSKILLIPFSFYWLNKRIDRLCKKYDVNSSKYIICVGSFNKEKEIIERRKLGALTSLPFESDSFCAYEGYDEWLTQIFGDYMQLPPIEKRITHHTFKMYKK